MDAAVGRPRSYAAHQHLVLRAVIPLHAAIGSRGERIVFPAHSVGECEIGCDVPAISDVQSKVMLARGEAGIGSHEDFAFVGGEAPQEAGITVVLAAGGAAKDLCGA